MTTQAAIDHTRGIVAFALARRAVLLAAREVDEARQTGDNEALAKANVRERIARGRLLALETHQPAKSSSDSSS